MNTQTQTQTQTFTIAGQTLQQLALRAGQTPFYVYDRSSIKDRITTLKKLLPSSVHLHYAMKANPMAALVDAMANLVDGIDVASGAELLTALNSGMSPKHISFAGPGKRQGELEQAIASEILLNIESQTELETIDRLSSKIGKMARVAVRVNPDFELKMSGMRMGGGSKPFGVDVENVTELIKKIANMGLIFEGLHFFPGAQCLKAEAIIEPQNRTIDLALHLAMQAQCAFNVINIGGGFGIPYFQGEKALEIQPIAENLHRLSEKLNRELPTAHIVLELGRYLVGEAGHYVTRILERKVSRGITYLITDGGLHHHLAASGNFGQVIRKNYPVKLIPQKETSAIESNVTVVGVLCTPLDIMASGLDLPHANPGDYFVILQSGAYGYSASPQLFLGHPSPIEILI